MDRIVATLTYEKVLPMVIHKPLLGLLSVLMVDVRLDSQVGTSTGTGEMMTFAPLSPTLFCGLAKQAFHRRDQKWSPRWELTHYWRIKITIRLKTSTRKESSQSFN